MDDKNVKKKEKGHTVNQKQPADVAPIAEDEYKNKYLRALADYQNLVKRVEKEKQDFVHYANERLILNLLEITDDFERALKEVTDTGIALIYKKLCDLISSEGVERISIQETDLFNPDYMQCIDAEPEGAKLVEVRPGYRKNGKVIRAALVKVVK